MADVAGIDRTVLAAAGDVLNRAGTIPPGVASRAAALLGRQALEEAIRDELAVRSPGAEHASARAKLLCLAGLGGDTDRAALASHTWWALSTVCHHTVYELAPDVVHVRALLDDVEAFLDGGMTPSRPA